MKRLLAWIFRGSRADAEVSEEIRFHLESRAALNRASGMSEEGAFDAARRQFGNRTIAQEAARRMHVNDLFESIAQDAQYAVRGFLKNPVFTATAILAMALGIGSTTAVFSVIDRILFRPLPYPNAERLVSFGFRAPIEPTEFMLGADYFEWRDRQLVSKR